MRTCSTKTPLVLCSSFVDTVIPSRLNQLYHSGDSLLFSCSRLQRDFEDPTLWKPTIFAKINSKVFPEGIELPTLSQRYLLCWWPTILYLTVHNIDALENNALNIYCIKDKFFNIFDAVLNSAPHSAVITRKENYYYKPTPCSFSLLLKHVSS